LNEPFASCESWAGSDYVAYLVQQPYEGLVTQEPDADEVARDLNPDFQPATHPLPSADAVRQALSSARIRKLLVWPDCSIDAASLGPVVFQSGDARLIQLSR
jgi:hypothetical protein